MPLITVINTNRQIKLSPMKQLTLYLLNLTPLLLLSACRTTPPAPPPMTPTAANAAATPTDSLVPDTTISTTTSASHSPTPVTLTILYTNDEHGWMEGQDAGKSAANLMGLWRDQHGYNQDGNFLILSGGDNWTGPAISTWFDGASMVEVMNAMQYTASAVGNHEFDFGLDALQQRISEANFPYLSANLRYEDGSFPLDLGFAPFVIIEIDGLQIGITGLTTTGTPVTTNPVNVAEFTFMDYAPALAEVVPEMQAAGADLILVPSHVCVNELIDLINETAELGIHLFGAGHCNERIADEFNGTIMLGGGAHLSRYAFATFEVNPAENRVIPLEYGVRVNEAAEDDPAVLAVVEKWQNAAADELNVTIGYLGRDIPIRGNTMQQLITEAWLWGYPAADVAITNLGGMRDSWQAGELTFADILSVMPFDNYLVEVRLTGSELIQILNRTEDAVGGVYRQTGEWILNKTDQPIARDMVYSLLVSDFMYAGGDGYSQLAIFDPEAYNTAIDWRQPVIDWMLEQASTPESPLDEAIDELIGD